MGATSNVEQKNCDNDDGMSRLNLNVTTADNKLLNNQRKPGTLPESAGDTSNAARALLMRLLDPDPKVRLKSMRQLQQTAFYMGFNFEHVKAKKVSPKTVLEGLIPNTSDSSVMDAPPRGKEFTLFDQCELPL